MSLGPAGGSGGKHEAARDATQDAFTNRAARLWRDIVQVELARHRVRSGGRNCADS